MIGQRPWRPGTAGGLVRTDLRDHYLRDRLIGLSDSWIQKLREISKITIKFLASVMG